MTLRAAAWFLWFLACFWLWMLLVGDWNRIELIAGACAASVAATLAETIRASARVDLRLAPDVFRSSALVLPMVFVDFGIVTVALARALVTRGGVSGKYVTRPFDPGAKTTSRGSARRAWTVLLAGYSPNAYVVDIDVENQTVLIHDLVPHRSSEKPA
jgi:hypothetical protein